MRHQGVSRAAWRPESHQPLGKALAVLQEPAFSWTSSPSLALALSERQQLSEVCPQVVARWRRGWKQRS